jgi:hypothetical protein
MADKIQFEDISMMIDLIRWISECEVRDADEFNKLVTIAFRQIKVRQLNKEREDI